MKNWIKIVIVIISFSSAAQAQKNLGIATGNWSVLNSSYLNPANIADSKDKFALDIVMINAGLDNNLGSLNNKKGIIGTIKDGDTKNLFNFSDRKTISLLAPYAEVRGPSLMLNIAPKHSIAFTTRIRGMNQLNNFDRSLYQTISDPTYTADGNYDFSSKNFNYTAHVWSEVDFSYAAVLLDRGNNKLKAGVTLRYLGGIGYIGLKGNNLDAHYNSGADSFYASHTDLEFASNLLSTRTAITNGITKNSLLSQFFGAKAGSGFGADLGIVYEFIPDELRSRYNMNGTKNITNHSGVEYKWRLAASITDIGSIKYASSNNSNANVSGDGYITGKGLTDNVKTFDEFRAYAIKQGFHADTNKVDTRVYMPTAMLINFDYYIKGHFFANVTYVGNVANRRNFGNSFYSQATLTPRFETSRFGIGLPVTYSMLSNSTKIGLGLRFSAFYVGSDDMLALFTNGQYGFNFYLGGSVQIHQKKPKDTDGDGVSDNKDKCPDEFGTWENRGCPDKSSNDADKEDEIMDKKK